jgi:hypothetical protein
MREPVLIKGRESYQRRNANVSSTHLQQTK